MDPYTKERCQELYEQLYSSEKFGIKMGLFPVRLEELFREMGITAVDLMEYDDEAENKNKHEITHEKVKLPKL